MRANELATALGLAATNYSSDDSGPVAVTYVDYSVLNHPRNPHRHICITATVVGDPETGVVVDLLVEDVASGRLTHLIDTGNPTAMLIVVNGLAATYPPNPQKLL